MALTSITKDFVVKSGALTEGTAFVSSSTGQTSTLQVNGGVAIAKNLIVGTTATIWGNSTLVGTLNVGGYSTLGMVTATVFTATSANIIGNETVGGNLQVTGLFTATGAAELGNTLKVTGASLFNGAVNTFSGALFVTGTNITALGGTLSVAGNTTITTSTTANSGANTGALVVSGGTVIGDNLVVKSTATNTATNTANAIYTAGGIYADKGLTVAGPVLFKDIVTFNGTATYVLSTNTYYTDNLLEIHTPPGGVYSPWFLDDGKDIGFRFHYYTGGTDTNAALVLDNTTKYLDWYNIGAEATNGDFSTATFGTFRTGNFISMGGVAATNTTSGSLQILNGGAGIGGALWATSLAATNLTTASGIVYSINNKLQNAPVTWNDTTQRLVGTIDLANTATNVTGGAAGSLVYQSGQSQTTTLPIGTNGYILQVTGGNPTWSPVTGLTAGLATTSTNIAGGLKDQIPFQSAPGQTTFNVGLVYNGTTFTTTNIVVTNGLDSVNYGYNTGSFVTAGGASIAKSVYIGGDLNLAGNLYLKGVGLDQITGSTGTFDFLIVEGTGTSLLVSDGSTFGGITTVTNATASLGAAGTGAFQVRGGVGITKDIYVGTTATIAGILLETNTTPSLGVAAAGAVQVTGGVGIAKDIYVGTTGTFAGTLFATGTTPNLGVAAGGVIQVTGGVGIAKDIYVGTTATVAGTLFATSTAPALSGGANTAAVEVTGGVDITKDIYVGTTATIAGVTFHNNTTPSLASATQGAVQTTGGVGIAKDIYIGTTATVAGTLFATSTTPSLGSATAGVIQVTGGVGVAKDIYVGTTATIGGAASVSTSLTVTGFTALNGGASATAMTITNSTAVATTGTGALTVPYGGVGIGGGLVVGGITTTTNTLPALGAAGVASVQMTGGVGVAKDIYIGTTATVAGIFLETNATPSLGVAAAGAVQITGGVGIAKDIYVGTTATIAGVTFHNNTTPSLGSATQGAVQTTGGVGVAKDLYVGTTATVAGILLETNTTPSLGVAAAGAVQVTGGVGIAKDLYVGTTGTFGTSVSAPNFYGTFNGGVTGGASTLYTQANYSATGAYYPTFVSANNASASSMTVYTTSSLTITPATGAVQIAGNLTVTSAGTTYFQNATDSNATNNGAVIITGGIGIAKAATIGTTITVGSASSATTVNSLYSNNYLISSYTSGFITTNALINLDTFSSTAYRTAKYVVQIVDTGTTPPKVHTEEIMLFHDGVSVYMTEYGISTNLGELGTFDSTIGAGTVTLNFQANYTPTNMTVKTMRTAITV